MADRRLGRQTIGQTDIDGQTHGKTARCKLNASNRQTEKCTSRQVYSHSSVAVAELGQTIAGLSLLRGLCLTTLNKLFLHTHSCGNKQIGFYSMWAVFDFPTFLCACLSYSVCISLSHWVSLSLRLFICVSFVVLYCIIIFVSLSCLGWLSVFMFLFVSLCVSFYLAVPLSVCLVSECLSVCLLVSLSSDICSCLFVSFLLAVHIWKETRTNER